MRLTTKGRYAVTAMLDLALHTDGRPVTLADIAERQGLSLPYLEQLFSKLKQCQLVTGTRGPGGGYSLGRPPASLAIADVIEAVDESVDATRCKGSQSCQQGAICLTHHLWCDLNHHIRDFLGGISLADLLAREDILAVAARQDQAKATVTRTHSAQI
ncbi:MAG: Rrf2 family transcriptional regulator [Kistimonas sp.]|nr:Rrf2 family transcriptional regulator [Kistimonas sp.]